MNIQVDSTSSNLASAMLNSKIRPRAVVGYGVKIFHPSPPNDVTRSPGVEQMFDNFNVNLPKKKGFLTYVPYIAGVHCHTTFETIQQSQESTRKKKMNIQTVWQRFRSVQCFVRDIFEEMFYSNL